MNSDDYDDDDDDGGGSWISIKSQSIKNNSLNGANTLHFPSFFNGKWTTKAIYKKSTHSDN